MKTKVVKFFQKWIIKWLSNLLERVSWKKGLLMRLSEGDVSLIRRVREREIRQSGHDGQTKAQIYE